jgi:hypothetical protein
MSAAPTPEAPKPAANALVALGWAVALILYVLGLYLTHVGTLFSKHWAPVAVLALMLLFVAGRAGGGVGIPLLFRDELDRRKGVNLGAPFWSAFGLTMLLGQVLATVYFAEWVGNYESIYVGSRPEYALLFEDVPSFLDQSTLRWFFFVAGAPYLGLVLVAMLLPTSIPGATVGPRVLAEAGKAALGMVAAGALLVGLTYLGAFAVDVLMRNGASFPSAREHFFKTGDTTFYSGLDEETRGIAVSFMVYARLSTVVIIATLVAVPARSFPPGFALNVLFAVPVFFYGFISALQPQAQLPFALIVVAVLVLCNSGAYKYAFPHMDAYADDPVKLAEMEPGKVAVAAPTELLDDHTVLEKWHAARRMDKPKLVLLAVTGGAYRSAYWTATVLDALNRRAELTNFPYHIRLITGASGGMVGAAYFAATLPEPGTGPLPGVVDALDADSRGDSLTPLVNQLVRRDLPKAFWPFGQKIDRGTVLEDQWKALAIPVRDLAAGEKAGWRPSLVISPMVVETGRRLLVSNLDLAGLDEIASRKPGSPSEAVGAVANPEGPAPRLYSRPAAEFFKIFPKADQFTLATAVRMNATFPYLSPAVSLPTDPPRRVVDAGYYDNYGVDLAMVWAYLNREWIQKNTGGLALVQLRAYRSEAERQELFVAERDRPADWSAKLVDKLATSFQWLTSPLEGGLSARAWSMSFRNDESIRAIDDSFNELNKPRFFETFVFENAVEAALNWFVSEGDLAQMRASVAAGPNLAEMDRLAKWWA